MINKEILKKQIIYRSTHRGTKEMDLLLGSFVKKNIDKFSDIELLYSIEDDSVYLSWLEKRSETLNINISDLVDGNLQDQLKDTSNKKNTNIDNNNSIIDKSLFENLKNTIDTSKINFNMNKGILPNGMILDSSKIKIQKGE